MAKHRKAEKNTRRKNQVSGIWLWVVAGIAVIVALYSLARTLSYTTAELPPMPILSNADQDLVSVTRMLGDVVLDSAGLARLDSAARARLAPVDSLVTERDWYGAIARLRPLLKSAPLEARSALRAYSGFCHSHAASPDRALFEYRKSLEEDSANTASSFSVGYLFQSRGMPDSALTYYAAVNEGAPGLYVAALNNLGVAYEKTGDTARAVSHYRAAAEAIDSLADPRARRTLRENLERVTPAQPRD